MKKLVIALLILTAIGANMFTFLMPLYSIKSPTLTGNFGAMGTIGLVILSPEMNIYIHSPLNATYNFSAGAVYLFDLNVSSDSVVDKWWYTLEDLKRGVVLNQSLFFSPNATFVAARWSNRLTVYANDTGGTTVNVSVVFGVNVENSAPVLGYIDPELYVCEDEFLSYMFNATDVDEQDLILDLTPKVPFFVEPSYFVGETIIVGEILSGILRKERVGKYARTVYVSDGQYVDSRNLNITVLEINHAPIIDTIGVQTVWARGENSSFYKQVTVEDTEDGDENSNTLNFSLVFLSGESFFNISQTGIMNVTPNSSNVGVYNLSAYVNDLGLAVLHPNRSICLETGLSKISCKNFSLTVTNENRPPTIVSYTPEESTMEGTGSETFIFTVANYDPDYTVPDTRWYVDGALKEYDSGSLLNRFDYSFGCEAEEGEHTVRVEITDGLLNDTVSWMVDLTDTACASSGGGGGGGGATPVEVKVCKERWVCDGWRICQNAKSSLENGVLNREDYRLISEDCALQFLGEDACGFQLRGCFDLSGCNKTLNRPSQVKYCRYSSSPSCSDGLLNCHGGDCEVLTDCGGPCGPCPTCSDGIQNQREKGVDCGGPCPIACLERVVTRDTSAFKYGLMAVIGLLLIVVLVQMVRVFKARKELYSRYHVSQAPLKISPAKVFSPEESFAGTVLKKARLAVIILAVFGLVAVGVYMYTLSSFSAYAIAESQGSDSMVSYIFGLPSFWIVTVLIVILGVLAYRYFREKSHLR